MVVQCTVMTVITSHWVCKEHLGAALLGLNISHLPKLTSVDPMDVPAVSIMGCW